MTERLLDYFGGDELAAGAWYGKYRNDGEATPDDMHRRLAKEFFKVEKKYQLLDTASPRVKATLSDYGAFRKELTEESIYQMLKDFKYLIPQGSVMSQLGNNDSLGSISNCVVIPSPHDSYGGIMKSDELLVQLMKRRCGVGTDISTLRPATAKVSNAATSSTGVVSFMDRYSNSTREVAQGGRRGALMLSINIQHPDVKDFVTVKRDLTRVTGANISVRMTDDFLTAVEHDTDYVLRFPCNDDDSNAIAEQHIDDLSYGELEVFSVPDSDKLVYLRKVKAKELYDEFIESNWLSAEPGLLLWGNVINNSPDAAYDEYIQTSTNPCSEIAMQGYDTYRLIVINLTAFVKEPYSDCPVFNMTKLYEIAYEQQRLADDIVDLEIAKIDAILDKIRSEHQESSVEEELWVKIKETANNGRRTGCGFTGLGDAIAMMGYPYDSDESIDLVNSIMRTKMEAELDCTTDMAVCRGTFKEWDSEKEDNEFYISLEAMFPERASRMAKVGRRNISWSTVAPTGTVSMLAQTTSGIEPVFMTHYTRRKKVNANDTDARVDFVDVNGDKWQEYAVMHHGLANWWKVKGYSEELPELSDMSPEDVASVIVDSPYHGSTASEIDWGKRVVLQSIVQKYTTHSISSTINLPKDATRQDVSDIYMESWRNGLKGITVYRDGCRDGVLVSNDTEPVDELEHVASVKRPKSLDADVYHVQAKGNPFTIIIGLLNDKPYEVFGVYGSQGKHRQKGALTKKSANKYSLTQGEFTIDNITVEMEDEEVALTRMISMSLRHRVGVKYIVEQLGKSGGFISSYTKAISRTLKRYIADGETVKSKCSNPDCTGTGDNVVFEEGCSKCLDCGSSACS